MSNEVQNPIINSPFFAPKQHWLIEYGKSPVQAQGRRPASYYYRVPESAGRGRKNKNQTTLQGDLDVGEQEDLPIVNWLRNRIKEWRTGELTGIPYDGASPVTKELLALWTAGSDRRKQRLFFAQIEAAETIIFLVEAAVVYKKWLDEKIPPGRNSRCIVSVSMLAEGWDANTVTHIVGLRPFGSQLLCEQVVGSGTRLRKYPSIPRKYPIRLN